MIAKNIALKTSTNIVSGEVIATNRSRPDGKLDHRHRAVPSGSIMQGKDMKIAWAKHKKLMG